MLWKIFAAFVILPIAEIYVLIQIGSHIGALWKIFLVIITAFVGAFLAKMQGAQTMFRLRMNVQQGIPPTHDILDAFLIFAAGIVFLTPGFITDLAGLFLLIPQTRRIVRMWLIKKIDRWMRGGNVHVIRR